MQLQIPCPYIRPYTGTSRYLQFRQLLDLTDFSAQNPLSSLTVCHPDWCWINNNNSYNCIIMYIYIYYNDIICIYIYWSNSPIKPLSTFPYSPSINSDEMKTAQFAAAKLHRILCHPFGRTCARGVPEKIEMCFQRIG